MNLIKTAAALSVAVAMGMTSAMAQIMKIISFRKLVLKFKPLIFIRLTLTYLIFCLFYNKSKIKKWSKTHKMKFFSKIYHKIIFIK